MSTFYIFLYILCNILMFAIVMRSIMTWFPMSSGNRFVVALYQITEPILEPLRRIVPKIGMIDLTPMAAILILWITAELVISLS
ncbi:MAG: YggT family protein [Dehalococcoidia bacterium]